MLLRRRSYLIAALQMLLVLFALQTAWLLRFDFKFPHGAIVLRSAPLLVLLRLFALSRFNLLHGYWRYTGATDAVSVAKAVLLGSISFVVVERFVLGVEAFPRSVYVIEAVLSFLLLTGVRVVSREMISEFVGGRLRITGKRALVIGAGHAAQLLIREMPGMGYLPVGCVDDDPYKVGASVRGVRVLGSIANLAAAVEECSAEELFIAIPSAGAGEMRRIVQHCLSTNVRFRTVPKLQEILAGKSLSAVKEICLEDLLGREPVRLDLQPVQEHLRGKNVMVTGAAGSIGSELCRQITAYGPARLICVDQAETPLFFVEAELRVIAREMLVCYVADITNTAEMRRILREQQVDIIFHAAAYKHVPLMEQNVREAVRNNVIALRELADTAEACGCEQFLLISSDKAVNPTSFMGCTKRVGELILAGRPKRTMNCTSVRFGNVLGSQGSVVPIFQEQIKHGRVKVTHPEITRFFMTIPEAVSLVLQAATVGSHGDVLVLDMGEPIRILDMARTLIRLNGNSEDEVKIVFTGLRPGEKLYEELFYEAEQRLETPNLKVNRARGEVLDGRRLQSQIRELAALVADGTEMSIREKMREIVPQYSYESYTSRTEVRFESEIGRLPQVAGSAAND